MNSIEGRGYPHLANGLAQQFSDGQNVDVGNLIYLRDSSDDSRDSYDRLMDRIADMYEVTPRDAVPESTHADRVKSIGGYVLGHSDEF